jgi:hypothetical protein
MSAKTAKRAAWKAVDGDGDGKSAEKYCCGRAKKDWNYTWK